MGGATAGAASATFLCGEASSAKLPLSSSEALTGSWAWLLPRVFSYSSRPVRMSDMTHTHTQCQLARARLHGDSSTRIGTVKDKKALAGACMLGYPCMHVGGGGM